MRSPVGLVLIHGSWCINKDTSGWFETNEKVIFPLFRVFWFDIDYEVKKQGNEQDREKDGRKRDRERALEATATGWMLFSSDVYGGMSVEGCLLARMWSKKTGSRRKRHGKSKLLPPRNDRDKTTRIKSTSFRHVESSYDSAFTRVAVTSWSFQVALKTFATMQRKIIFARSFAKIFREESFDFCILWEKRDWKCVYKLQNIYCQHIVLSRKPVYNVNSYLKHIILGGCVM